MALKSARRLAEAAWEMRTDAEPRSLEYQDGWKCVYASLFAKEPLSPVPYQEGTVQAEDWLAGVDAGRSEWQMKRNKN